MPDYAPDAYAWDYDSSHLITPLSDYFPDNPELIAIEDELSKWCDWYDKSFPLDGRNPFFPWADFDKQGMALARRLARVMKQYGVEVYYKFLNNVPAGQTESVVRVDDLFEDTKRE